MNTLAKGIRVYSDAQLALALYAKLHAQATARAGRAPCEGELVMKQYEGAPAEPGGLLIDLLVVVADHAAVNRVVDRIIARERRPGMAVEEWMQHLA